MKPVRRPAPPRFARAVYALVRQIPRGKVATYGQVAAILGQPRAARAVGTALSRLPNHLGRIVPWQRVINAAGGISCRGEVHRPDLQRELLELEGVVFRGAHTDLSAYRWPGPARERKTALRVELPLQTDKGLGSRRGARAKRRRM